MNVFLWAFNTITESDREILKGLLLEEELVRLSEISSEKKADEFLCGRSLLRWSLKERNKKFEMPLRYHESGKPYLPNMEVGLAHSGGALCLALDEKFTIGVDLEEMSPRRNFDLLTKRVFCEEERSKFKTMSSEKARSFFYHVWVIKEAEVKRMGAGIVHGEIFEKSVFQILKKQSCVLFEWKNFAGALISEAIGDLSVFEVSLNDGIFEVSKASLKTFDREFLSREDS